MNEPTVYLVDDDNAVLKSLRWLIESVGLKTKSVGAASSFLDIYDPYSPGCLVLDVRMPGMTGLQLQVLLNERGIEVPVIIMTGHSDVATCTESFRNGAFDFIEKPADDEFLLSRIRAAIKSDFERCRLEDSKRKIQTRIAALTPREREVMNAIVCGKPQKLIASELGISFQTAAKHRAKVLQKLQVANDVEILRTVLTMEATPEAVSV